MKRKIKVFVWVSILFLLASSGQAYELSGGNKKDANELVSKINLYYKASQQEDTKSYADLFIFASKENMAERIGTAIQLWQMYDLKDYKVQVQEISISPSGTTGLARYQVKTTLANTQGEKKSTENEFMALFFKQDGVWLLADINFADQFQASMEQLNMVQSYADHPDNVLPGPVRKPSTKKQKKISSAKAGKGKKKDKKLNLSGMKKYKDKEHNAFFYYPEETTITTKEAKVYFKNNGGSVHIIYEPMAYAKNGGKYKNSKDLVRFVSEKMQKEFNAKIMNTSFVKVGSLSGTRLRFSWSIEGQKLEQVETVLDGSEKMFSFGMLGSPDAFKSYAARYESMFKSFHFGETISEKKEKKKEVILIAFPDRGAVTGTITKESFTVYFTTEKDAKHVVKCTTMEQAPVYFVLYDEQGKKVDENYRDGQLYQGFKEVLPRGEKYFLMVAPFKNMNLGKPVTLQIYTE